MRLIKHVIHSPYFHKKVIEGCALSEENAEKLLTFRYGDQVMYTDQELEQMMFEPLCTEEEFLQMYDLSTVFPASKDELTNILLFHEMCYNKMDAGVKRSVSEVKALLSHHYDSGKSPFTSKETFCDKMNKIDVFRYNDLKNALSDWGCTLYNVQSTVLQFIFAHGESTLDNLEPFTKVPYEKIIECTSDYKTSQCLDYMLFGTHCEKYDASLHEELCAFLLNLVIKHPLYENSPKALIQNICEFGL